MFSFLRSSISSSSSGSKKALRSEELYDQKLDVHNNSFEDEDEDGSLKWLGLGKNMELVCEQKETGSLLRNKRLRNRNVGLVCIFGPARQGKSFLMNLLSRKENLFEISNSRKPCTSGVDLSKRFLSLREFGEPFFV